MCNFRVIKELYDENGYCIKVDIPQSNLLTPERLVWETSAGLTSKVQQALDSNIKVNLILKIILDLFWFNQLQLSVSHLLSS